MYVITTLPGSKPSQGFCLKKPKTLKRSKDVPGADLVFSQNSVNTELNLQNSNTQA